jgi:hypothetical protein
MRKYNLIEDFIEKVFENFQEKEDQWCDLQNFELNITNYNNELNQEYYLLKYFPAYFIEYYTSFKDFFQLYRKKSLKVISIGCGAGIDFYALECYIEKSKLKIILDYTCIDVIDWQYKPDDIRFNYIHSDILQTDKNLFDNVDLIIFPKILTELEDSTLEYIGDLLTNSNLKNELYFINSYITNDSHNSTKKDGINQFNKVCTKLKVNGYKIANNVKCNSYKYFKTHMELKDIYRFNYPNEILDILFNLKDNCKFKNLEGYGCDNCNIKIFPMMNTKYIANLIIKFEK